jgi:hypothetical protein
MAAWGYGDPGSGWLDASGDLIIRKLSFRLAIKAR